MILNGNNNVHVLRIIFQVCKLLFHWLKIQIIDGLIQSSLLLDIWCISITAFNMDYILFTKKLKRITYIGNTNIIILLSFEIAIRNTVCITIQLDGWIWCTVYCNTIIAQWKTFSAHCPKFYQSKASLNFGCFKHAKYVQSEFPLVKNFNPPRRPANNFRPPSKSSEEY